MFKTLEEVKRQWADRYQQTGCEFDLLPSPGCSEAEILELEKALEVKINASYRWILRDVNLNTVAFSSYRFTSSNDTIRSLRRLNKDEVFYTENEYLKQGVLVVSGTEAYIVMIDNFTGIVYCYDHELDPETKKPVAQNMEEYICIAASIADYKWPEFESREHAIKVATDCLNKMGIEQGKEFWIDFIRGAA